MPDPKKIAFLKKGTFKDSSGKEHTFGDAELDTIVAKYDPSQHEAPEVIGHPKSDAPAWGWVKGVRREGDVLFYEPGQRVAEFQDMVDKGMFKKRSAAFYPDLTLKHVGWLGAQPPSIKGLPDPVTFAEGDSITIEFSESSAINTIGQVLGRLRDFIIAKFGQDTADQVVNSDEIDYMKNCMPDDMPAPVEETAAAEAGAAFSESKKEEEMGEIEDLKKQIADKDKEIATFAESEKATKARLLVIETENKRKDFAAFCEGLSKEGKLPPAIVPYVMDFMEILSGVETFEFSEPAEKEGEAPKKVAAAPVERFKAMLSGLGKVIEFSEIATKGNATDKGSKDREQHIAEFQEKNKVTYKEAVLAVSKEHPELFEER